MTDYGQLLPVAVAAVELGRQIMRRKTPAVVLRKGDRDIASDVDFEIEQAVRTFLSGETPDVGFLGEETGAHGSEDLRWVLDPVDGTSNYARGLPLCGISLALVHRRQPMLGVIDLPFLDSRYTAAHRRGAWVNGRPIRVSGTDRLDQAIVAIGDYAVGHEAASKNQTRLALTAQLAEQVQRIRMNGSVATDLAWLAEGKLDGSLTLSNHEWDMAAGVVIAREAGARIIDIDGTDHTSSSAVTLASTPALADKLLALVQQATRQRHDRSRSTEQ